jgi:hypothetical protein
VLEITERALLCANPELLDENWHAQRGRSHFASLRAAHRIMARGYALEREIRLWLNVSAIPVFSLCSSFPLSVFLCVQRPSRSHDSF